MTNEEIYLRKQIPTMVGENNISSMKLNTMLSLLHDYAKEYHQSKMNKYDIINSVCNHQNYRQGWNINQPCICNDCGEEL